MWHLCNFMACKTFNYKHCGVPFLITNVHNIDDVLCTSSAGTEYHTAHPSRLPIT